MHQELLLPCAQKYNTITGHNLQGLPLDRIVVRSWSYKFPNWVYDVLSRVGTFKGFFFCQKLGNAKYLHVDLKLS